MTPLEIAQELGITYRTTPSNTTEMFGYDDSIQRLYWRGYYDGKKVRLFHGTHTTFNIGDIVEKRSGSSWHGRVVGYYSTELTPEGYAVESSREPGSVQIYPVKALMRSV